MITLTVRRVVRVEGIAFAQRVTATYDNPGRSDSTPCPLGPSRDAGRYSGATLIPSPPLASFTSAVDPATDTASFFDTSSRGRGGARVTQVSWSFGDVASGAANDSASRDPTHHFTAPGIYLVTLTVIDANRSRSTSSAEVTAPGPPHAAFTAAEQGSSATFLFLDGSTRGVGAAPIVAWRWSFGDPGSGAQETSTLQNPSHAFTATGNYAVTLTVLDANGYICSPSEIVSYP